MLNSYCHRGYCRLNQQQVAKAREGLADTKMFLQVFGLHALSAVVLASAWYAFLA